MTVSPYALEHGSSRAGRWLRARRLWIALWLAVVEGVLVVMDVVPGWIAVLGAIAVITLSITAGRRTRFDLVRQTAWIAAASQVLVVLVPALVAAAAALVFVALAVVAVVALLAFFVSRR